MLLSVVKFFLTNDKYLPFVKFLRLVKFFQRTRLFCVRKVHLVSSLKGRNSCVCEVFEFCEVFSKDGTLLCS